MGGLPWHDRRGGAGTRHLGPAAVAGFALASAIATLPAVVASGADRKIERGRHFTHDVAMCMQCHTPRREDGTLVEARLFGGAPVPFARPPFANLRWAARAPALAGLPGFSDEDEVVLLTTGKRPAGRTPDPPMPPFRVSREDAEAIVAYLRSLPPPSTP
jgi:mono/diheme cytochrome c family protein